MAKNHNRRPIIRPPFPKLTPDVSNIDTPALSTWLNECLLYAAAIEWWRPDGLRWRWATWRAHREFSCRLLADAAQQALCQECRSQAATHHVVYGPHGAPVFAHYCNACNGTAPRGWMVVVKI